MKMQPLRCAYADPPYVGQAKRHYDMPEVNHEELINWLYREFPDGWALSCSTPSLKDLLPLCSSDVRLGAWVKPFHAYKRGVRPAYAWEVVIYRGGRNRNAPVPKKGGKAITPKDFHVANITLKKGLTGAKPESFCHWIIDLLGLQPGDTLEDMYPGTGIMTRVIQERL